MAAINTKEKKQESRRRLTKTKDKPAEKDKDKKQDNKKPNHPPFSDSPGKLGDTKKWKGETYYFCPATHKYSHWHKFKVDECRTYQKWKGGESNNDSTPNNQSRVFVDRDKLEKGMAALFPCGNFNTDDLAEALVSALQE